MYKRQGLRRLLVHGGNLPQVGGGHVAALVQKDGEVTDLIPQLRGAAVSYTHLDVYKRQPYHTAILLARIAALLKRAYPHQPDPALTWRGATLHLDRSQLTYQEATADLTRNELKILAYLFRHAGTICARGDLVSYLWDNQFYVDDNALSVNIGRIREKLAGIGLTGFIQTKHRQRCV